MDHSIFSLFTTKDWPFQSPTQPSPASDEQDNTNKTTTPKLRSRQETIDGLLFFDRLMKLAAIPNYNHLFPPTHPSRLRHLLDSIEACHFDLLKKNCLVYYLLKEYGDGRETRFAIDRLIPSHFSRGLDGLWALDHSQWQAAIRSMSDPCVTPDFLPEIIRTLATQPAVKLRSHFVMRFYQLVQPSLELPSIEFVLRAMCLNSNLRSAWALQRSYNQPHRIKLLRIIFETCFGLNDHRQPLAEALQILIAFPFDELEDSNLSRFAVRAPQLLPASHAMVAIQFYLNKLTCEARYIEAIRFERELSESAGIVSNPDIDRVIRGIAEILPQVQRNMLELEFDEQHPILNPTPNSAGMAQDASNDMDMSASYDVCSLAWDPPDSPPVLPPPTSLTEARRQQELINQPKPAIPKSSLPLSASPFLRRSMPRMSLDRSNVPQKVLLQALAFTRQSPARRPRSPILDEESRVQMDGKGDAGDSEMPSPSAPSRATPRFTHFVAPSRQATSGSKPPPPPPNFSTSFARSSVTVPGSPFHRLSFSEAEKPSPSGPEERWPSHIAFTPRRPSHKRAEERPAKQQQQQQQLNVTQNRSEARQAASSESSDEPVVSRPAPAAAPKQHFAAVVVPRTSRRELKSPPKKVARVSASSARRPPPPPARVERVLPGGLNFDDEEMDSLPENTDQHDNEDDDDEDGQAGPRTHESHSKEEHLSSSHHHRATTVRKKVKMDQQPFHAQASSSAATTVPPITPRRSRRLHSSTPANNKIRLPGAIAGLDSLNDDNDDDDDLSLRNPPKKTPAKPKAAPRRKPFPHK